MAKRTRTQLKNTFVTGYKPTEADFTNLLDSYHHKDDSLNDFVPKYPSYLDFTGRFTLENNKWTGSNSDYGQMEPIETRISEIILDHPCFGII